MVHPVIPNPTPQGANVVTTDELYHWLDTTDADITFIGKPIDRNAPRSAEDVTVIYCSKIVGSICSGPCTVYYGGPTCLYAPDTNCLSASDNVAFCDGSDCNGSCNMFGSCGGRMDNGFCATPGTNSILV
ncbi:hypothetical protein L226DRAFT_266015 [Lentinus tigrinus ALCF2SS1-7]|uniref:uncharacterized protein n=1 Tax=Lentinus tigrinus ALCF2SS1-7 TaxID=1328758 RepID=UPI0011660AC2|nr:hypothetical protein L226DRAFT_266015 [Lentinus tigrinus ALCF2SS1-7]